MKNRPSYPGAVLVVSLTLGATNLGAQDVFPPVDGEVYRVVNSVAFSPAGDQIYFAALYHPYLESHGRSTESAPETAMFSVSRVGDEWSTPELLPFSGRFSDYEPTLSGDGRIMVFNSRRPYPDGRLPERNDLWMVSRESSGAWSEPIRIGSITTFDNEESYGTLSADGTLTFGRGRPARAEGRAEGVDYDLYWSRFAEGTFLTPERHPVSSERWGEGDPWVAADGSYLIFTRWDDSVGWAETVDLYIAYSDGTDWSDPVSLDELNTDGPDFGPDVSADGRWLYYRADSRFRRVALEPLLDRYVP